jgi:hypothetical protein
MKISVAAIVDIPFYAINTQVAPARELNIHPWTEFAADASPLADLREPSLESELALWELVPSE